MVVNCWWSAASSCYQGDLVDQFCSKTYCIFCARHCLNTTSCLLSSTPYTRDEAFLHHRENFLSVEVFQTSQWKSKGNSEGGQGSPANWCTRLCRLLPTHRTSSKNWWMQEGLSWNMGATCGRSRSKEGSQRWILCLSCFGSSWMQPLDLD